MAREGRGVFRMIFRNFLDSLKPRHYKGELVGKDHFGNSYYQILASDRQKKQRWFDPKEANKYDQEIPAEWESWLRYRRREPPTEQEVLANDAIARQKKINAANLLANRIAAGYTPPPTCTPKTGPESFPKYKEYEAVPGDKDDK